MQDFCLALFLSLLLPTSCLLNDKDGPQECGVFSLVIPGSFPGNSTSFTRARCSEPPSELLELLVAL